MSNSDSPSPLQPILNFNDEDEAMDHLVKEYQNQGISDLSLTKYKYLVQRGLQMIHPPLPIQNNKSKLSKFISSQELLQVDKTLVDKLEKDQKWQPYRARLFKNNSQHSLRSLHDKSSSKIYTGYGPLDEIAFQLGHNRAQIKHQNEQLSQLIEQYTISKSQQVGKLPRIKCYPSRLNDDGQKLNKHQPKVIELVQDASIPNYYLNWVERFYGKWRPPMREGATLSVIQNKFYLYGGISATPFNDMNVWNGNEWSQIEVIDKPPYGRTNHIAGVYRRSIFYFGGEKPYDNAQKIRESLNDFRVFNTETNEFKFVRTSGEGVEVRRGQASTLVGKHLFIMGGINTKGKYLSDAFHFDVTTSKQAPANIDNCNYFQNGIAFHTLVSVYNTNRLIQLYKSNLDVDDLKDMKQKVEGVYLFGGENKQGQLYSGFYLLNTYQRPMYWSEIKAKGIQPCARYKHSCNYFDKQQLIVIFGGINIDSIFLNDCHIFKVDSQTWCNIQMEYRDGRAGHCAAQDENRLLIFGGYNENGFVKADIVWLELDQNIQVKTQREKLSNMDTTKHEKMKEKQKVQDEQERLLKLREQIELLSFKGIKSFAPMPLIKQRSRSSLWKTVQSKKQQMLQLKIIEETQHLMKDFNNESVQRNEEKQQESTTPLVNQLDLKKIAKNFRSTN
ncbi:unnamed protein product [Paramecium sonneborni]|uniref:Kelch motif family protein n=2 Tax=Paramecium sonneborni TaxID=65129 RepID=A0A8S1R7N1_9CILI|nr:unnamed protein product [Paramecium sonneborni]